MKKIFPPLHLIFLRVSIIILLVILSVPTGLTSASSQTATTKGSTFSKLRQSLEKDGFDRQKLASYYSMSQVKFESEGTARFFRHNESKLNYDQFLEEKSIAPARAYMKEHAQWLKKAEKEYLVNREIIAAILLVETRLGTYLGKHSTFNMLSSMASLADPVIRDLFWQTIHKTTTMTRAKYKAKAARKSTWAYSELKAFLKYIEQEQIIDPGQIVGSYAGAVGISQFMPSNIITLGVDGDGNGQLDLFTHPDAILSVARYLHHYGWKPGLNKKKAYWVLFYYNHSKYYVNTLLKISEKLQEAF